MSELAKTKQWFEQAIPEPTVETACVQIGCHFEEVAEMFDALGMSSHARSMYQTANMFKTKGRIAMSVVKKVNMTALADSIGDQIVTGTGVMHNFKMNSLGIIGEINRSNFSKFEDGKPVFDANGKITKGKHYAPPDLTAYI